MARSVRAHLEQLIAGDAELREEYAALRLRRAIIAQLRALRVTRCPLGRPEA